MALAVYEEDEDNADNDASDDSEGDEAGGEDDSGGDGPEEEGYVKRLLDRGAETDDRKSADHTEGENRVRRYR